MSNMKEPAFRTEAPSLFRNSVNFKPPAPSKAKAPKFDARSQLERLLDSFTNDEKDEEAKSVASAEVAAAPIISHERSIVYALSVKILNFYNTSMIPKRQLTAGEGVDNHGFDNAQNDYILRAHDTIYSPEGQEFLILDMLGKATPRLLIVLVFGVFEILADQRVLGLLSRLNHPDPLNGAAAAPPNKTEHHQRKHHHVLGPAPHRPSLSSSGSIAQPDAPRAP